jgi:flagellar biosynthetic protein FliR
MSSILDIFSLHLAPALAVVFRVAGLALFAPILASIAVPARTKMFLYLLVGLSVYPTLAAGPLAAQPALPFSLGGLISLIAAELLIGAVIGFLALLPLAAMQMGGVVIGQQMGLGFARIYNPAFDDEADVIEQILFFLGLAVFIATGGLEHMMHAILRSFHFVRLGGVGAVLAVGGYGLDNGLLRLAAGTMLAATEVSLRIAAPLLCLFFLETIAMGFVSKSVPALNLMALGFPLRILAGLSIMVVGMAAVGEVLGAFLAADFVLLGEWFVVANGEVG